MTSICSNVILLMGKFHARPCTSKVTDQTRSPFSKPIERIGENLKNKEFNLVSAIDSKTGLHRNLFLYNWSPSHQLLISYKFTVLMTLIIYTSKLSPSKIIYTSKMRISKDRYRQYGHPSVTCLLSPKCFQCRD